jgi:hypothetical protein
MHSALQISVPPRKPESTGTGIRPPTASTISGSASMVERPASSLRALRERKKTLLEGSIARKWVYTHGARKAQFRPWEEKHDA